MQLSNGIIFLNRQADKYNTEQFISQIEEFTNHHTAPDAIILEQDQLKGMFRSTLWYGFKGTNVQLFFEEWEREYVELSKNQPKNSITKMYEPTGNMITMSKSYGSHEFTEQELDKLYKGDTIEFDFTSQFGNTKRISGKLDKKDWPEKEIIFWAFVSKDLRAQEDNMVTGIFRGEKIKFKNQFADYKLSKEDINKLLDGKILYTVITNKNGKRTSVRIKLVPVEGDYYKLQGTFDGLPYCTVSGKELTGVEIERFHLHPGEFFLLNGLKTRDGGTYSTEVAWKDRGYEFKKK